MRVSNFILHGQISNTCYNASFTCAHTVCGDTIQHWDITINELSQFTSRLTSFSLLLLLKRCEESLIFYEYFIYYKQSDFI